MKKIIDYSYYFRPSDNTLFKLDDEVKTKIDGIILGKITRIWVVADEVRIELFNYAKENIDKASYILYKPFHKNTLDKVK